MTANQYHPEVERRSPDSLALRQLAIDFINDFETDNTPKLDIITQLCHLALAENSTSGAKNATRVIFGGIIEPLCDSFSARGVDLCNQVLARILGIIRRETKGAILDQLLNKCGFYDEADILHRYEYIKKPRPLSRQRRRLINKIIILSRVTAGADIAITSVMVHRLRKSFPAAVIVLVGPAHLAAMFPELDNIRHQPFIYKNDGGLCDKMTSWPPLYEIIQQETEQDDPQNVLLFDPDSRMSQLGILPLLADDSTCYFPSRMWQSRSAVPGNLSILTNDWLNTILDETETEPPYLVLHNEGHGYNAFCRNFKVRSSLVIMVNFGVGNDFRKKVADPFEEELLLKLAKEPGNIIILDSGRGRDERVRVEYLIQQAEQQGINTASLSEEQIPQADIKFNNGLIAFSGSLDALGKMVCAADCFIGYDSCGQHLAAATGTPAVIVFAGAPSRRFIEHWSPLSGNIKTIIADSREYASTPGCRKLITQIREFTGRLKNVGNSIL